MVALQALASGAVRNAGANAATSEAEPPRKGAESAPGSAQDDGLEAVTRTLLPLLLEHAVCEAERDVAEQLAASAAASDFDIAGEHTDGALLASSIMHATIAGLFLIFYSCFIPLFLCCAK